METEDAPAVGDNAEKDDDRALQVGHAEREEGGEETNKKTTEDGDGVNEAETAEGRDGVDEAETNPPPNTYSLPSPLNTATLATSPVPHLASLPVACPATSTSTNLAIPTVSQQLVASPVEYPAAFAPANLATPPAVNLAIPTVSQQLAISPVTYPAAFAPANLVTPPAVQHLAASTMSPFSTPMISPPTTNPFGSSPADALGAGTFTSLLNSDGLSGWSDFGGSAWSDPFGSLSGLATGGSEFGMNMQNYSLAPPGTTSLHDLDLGSSSMSMTYLGLADFSVDQLSMFGTSNLNQSHKPLVLNTFDFGNMASSPSYPNTLPDSQVPLPILPAPLVASPPSALPEPLSDVNVIPTPVIPPTQRSMVNLPV